MRKGLFLTFLFIFITQLFSQNIYEIKSFKWGNKKSNVGIYKGLSDYIGPSEIKKFGGSLYLGDRVNGKIIQISDRNKEIPIPNNLKFFNDFSILDNGNIILLKNSNLYILDNFNEKKISLQNLYNDIYIRISPYENQIWLITSSEKSFLYDLNGNLLKVKGGIFNNGKFYFVKLLHKNRVEISISDINGISKKIFFNTNLNNVNSATFMGTDEDGNIYLKVTNLVRENPIRSDTYLFKVSSNGRILFKLRYPYIIWALVKNNTLILNNSEILFTIASKENFSIYKLKYNRNLKELDLKKYFNKSYHFRDFINRYVSKASTIKDNPPVYRDESLSTAYNYAHLNWVANSCNITGGIDCGGKTVTTPSWVTEGSQDKVPYKWGGFSSIEGFLQGIDNCKYAGDDNCTGGGSDCAVGVDCSGFVSRCWNTSQKYGTSSIPSISQEISTSDMLPGDVYNDPGSHVRMFVRRNPDGSVNCVESHGGTWCVEYTYYSSDPDGYTPMRYNNMVGYHKNGDGTSSNPIMVNTLPYQDSNSTENSTEYNFDHYSCAPSTNESGPEVYYKLNLNFYGTIEATVEDGSGVDIDPHILTSLSSDSCVARGDTTATYENAEPGTYYIVADTWVNSSGTALKGSYDISIDVSSNNVGTFQNPFLIKSFPFSHTYSTYRANSDSMDYYSCSPSTNESGPEVIYKFTLNCSGTIYVSVDDDSTTDIDIHLLDGKSENDCLIRDDSSFSYHISSGTYYIVADTYVDSSGNEKKGDYTLNVDFQMDNTDSDGDGIIDCEDPEPNVKQGDINDDGNIDITDALLLANYLTGNLSKGEAGCDYPDCGDLNLDGNLNAVDLAIYLNYITGNISNIPYNN